MILLQAEAISKQYGPDPLLNGVSFEVRPGNKVGLVGPNGSGKSTLLKICAGLIDADLGTVQVPAGTSVSYLEQQPTWDASRSVWEEAYSEMAAITDRAARAERIAAQIAATVDPVERVRLGKQYDRLHHEIELQGGYQVDHHVERVLTGLGFKRDELRQQLGQLSGGQQSRVLLAKLLLRGADVLLLDEPSNHLDVDATGWLEEFLREAPQAMILVSHDRYLLDKVTNRTLELYEGTVENYRGNFSAYWQQKDERHEVQRRTYERQQDEVARKEEFIRRNQAGQKSVQAKDRIKKLARMQLLSRPHEIPLPAMGFKSVGRPGDLVLRAEGLSKSYKTPLFTDLNFEIPRGERWGILGPNGSGKTTLLRCIIGEESLDRGKLVLGANVRIAYFDQHLQTLNPDEPLLDAIRPPAKEFNLQQRRDLLARFGFSGDEVHKQVSSLSGGEHNRAALALAAGSDANFLVFDEPTNHLDLWARSALERSLREYDGTVLLVTHDRYFLNRVVDRLLILGAGRAKVVLGGYEAYLAEMDRGKPSAGTPNKTASRRGPPARGSKRFPYRKLADIEGEIAEREARMAQLHSQLASPDLHRDGARVRAAKQQISDEQQKLEELYAHWEDAAASQG